MSLLEIIQYTLQLIGASIVIYGTAVTWLQKDLQWSGSFWRTIDTARAKQEVHEYGMYQSSKAIGGLVYVSTGLLMLAMCVAISFPNSLLNLLSDKHSTLSVAVNGTQFITLGSLVAVCATVALAWANDKVKIDLYSTAAVKILIVIAAIAGFVTIATIIFYMIAPAIGSVDEIVASTFVDPVDNITSDIILPFVAATNILAYPSAGLFVIAALVVLSASDLLSLHGGLSQITGRMLWRVFIFIVGFVGSVFYTLLSGAVGTSLEGGGQYQLSLQLLLSNAVCDGLTLYTTFALLNWASATWRCRSALSALESSVKGLLRISASYTITEFNQYRERINGLSEDEVTHMPLQHNLSPFAEVQKLASIFGHQNAMQFDRLLYRVVETKDDDVSLLKSPRVASVSFDQQRSWLMALLVKVELDIHAAGDKYDGRIGRNEPVNMPFTNVDAYMSRTWQELDKYRSIFRGRPAIALVVDLLLAGLFAYMSVFAGLFGTEDALSLQQLTNLFFGGYNGAGFTSVGPLFWVMHTTFIPSIILWTILGVLMLSAFVVSPTVEWVASKIGKRKSKENKLHPRIEVNLSIAKTGTLLLAVGTIINVVRVVFG